MNEVLEYKRKYVENFSAHPDNFLAPNGPEFDTLLRRVDSKG